MALKPTLESGAQAMGLSLPRAAGYRPLAARLRPTTLAEFVGQAPLVGERGALRRMVERGQLLSMVLWGPPGVGKTAAYRLNSPERLY